MSGVAGGSRIEKEDVQGTFDKYVKDILEKIPGFKKASLSGSVKTGDKPDYGDLDLITWFEGKDKREVKQRIIEIIKAQPDSIIVPFKSEKYVGKKYYNSGEIITNLFPIEGKQGEYIQVDNIIALTEEEHGFKNNFLDLPAEKQGLILGLIKIVLLEKEPQQVFKTLGIEKLPSLAEDEEFEFNLSSGKLTLRKVKLKEFKTIKKEEIWSSTNWQDIETLLTGIGINAKGTFNELLKDIKTKLKHPRSKNRIRGIFNSMISVKSGEVGTAKGNNKEKAINEVNKLLEETGTGTVGLYAGGFKPPHKAHFNNAKFLAKKVDSLIIFIGPKVREGVKITAEQSRDIWQIYSKHINTPVKIITSETSPIRDIYTFADENLENYEKIITGALPEEIRKFAYFEKNKEKYSNVEILELPRIGSIASKFSATSIRSSVHFLKKGEWVPSELSEKDKEAVISIAMMNAPSEKEIQMQEALDNKLDTMFTSEEEVKEGMNGSATAPKGVIQSSKRAELVDIYRQLRDSIDTQEFELGFHQDHISIRVKDENRKLGYDYTPYMASILEYMIDEGMNILPLPEVKVKEDITESANFFGKTAYYDPNNKEVVLYVKDRHPKDVMRSFAHEMIHHLQNLEGRLGGVATSNTNEDSSLMELEKEAYLQGNITFRNWEDKVKNVEKAIVGDRIKEAKEEVTDSMVVVLSRNDNQINLYNLKTNEALGNINTYGNEVNAVAAKKGYGPLMYELGMANIYPKGLQSDRRGNTEAPAEAVWKKYIEGASPNIKVEKLTPKDRDYRTTYAGDGYDSSYIPDFYNYKFYNPNTTTLKQLIQKGNTLSDELRKKIILDNDKLYNDLVNEAIVGDKIECDNCDWSWDIVSGGDDLFICHKCGHDNKPTGK